MIEERMTRTEMNGMKYGSACLSNLMYFEKDMEKRAGMIPDGVKRLHEAIEGYRAVYHDLCGTMPEKQQKALANVCRDMEVRLVPKGTPTNTTVTWDKDDAMELVDAAQAKCLDCFRDYEDSEGCPLRQLLESVVPLDRYSALSCPYNNATWEDD